jgi:hypothetical protein
MPSVRKFTGVNDPHNLASEGGARRMDGPGYLQIIRHYEQCLAEHGNTYHGVDRSSVESAALR